MEQAAYSVRLSLWGREKSIQLNDGALIVSGDPPIAFAGIREIRTYDSPGLTFLGGATIAPAFKRCVIRPARGRAIVLSSSNLLGFGRFEDRSASYEPFVGKLIQAAGAANPKTIFIAGMPMALWLSWLFILAMAAVIAPLALILIVVMLLGGHAPPVGLIVSAIVLLSVLTGIVQLIRMLRKNWPRAYDPRAGMRA
jgi:hypothetical protein